MKNQYFGDIRDLFKYDLIGWLMREIGSLENLTFIPMLTKYDPKGKDGNKRDFNKARSGHRPGTENERLVEFLQEYKKTPADRRDLRQIRAYLTKVFIHKVQGDEYFTKSTRDEYFRRIPEDRLHKALVFVDPDIGLEPEKSKPTEKHLKYLEVEDLYRRMDEDSILMIYQHFPRQPHGKYLCTRSNELKEKMGNLPMYISDGEIIFFFLTKDDQLGNKLKRAIDGYNKNYPKLKIGNL